MLAVEGIVKTYHPPEGVMRFLVRGATTEPVHALRGVSLSVERGEVVGLLGPNGAGKTTLIKAITGLLVADAGSIRYDGVELDPEDSAARGRFGLVLPDDRSYYWRLTGAQNLEFFAALAGLDRAAARARVRRLLEERGLLDRDRRVFGYSSGMRAQLGLARALLHEPDLLVLDEPTRSLDPLAATQVCDELRRLARSGRAILLATHRLEEVFEVCDRVVVIGRGRVVWTGTTEQLGSDPSGLKQSVTRLLDPSRQ